MTKRQNNMKTNEGNVTKMKSMNLISIKSNVIDFYNLEHHSDDHHQDHHLVDTNNKIT
jgi:hypothetical protein